MIGGSKSTLGVSLVGKFLRIINSILNEQIGQIYLVTQTSTIKLVMTGGANFLIIIQHDYTKNNKKLITGWQINIL